MEVRNAMEDIGLHWNERKCATVHVKRGRLEDSGEMRMGEAGQINSLKDEVPIQVSRSIREYSTRRQPGFGEC